MSKLFRHKAPPLPSLSWMSTPHMDSGWSLMSWASWNQKPVEKQENLGGQPTGPWTLLWILALFHLLSQPIFTVSPSGSLPTVLPTFSSCLAFHVVPWPRPTSFPPFSHPPFTNHKKVFLVPLKYILNLSTSILHYILSPNISYLECSKSILTSLSIIPSLQTNI